MLRDAGVAEDQVAEAMAFFHRRADRFRRGDDLEDVLADQLRHRDAPWYPVLGDDGVVEHLAFMARIYDYDPGPALERVTCTACACPPSGGAERGPRIPDPMDMVITWLRRALPPAPDPA
jgi:hypothetical protein